MSSRSLGLGDRRTVGGDEVIRDLGRPGGRVALLQRRDELRNLQDEVVPGEHGGEIGDLGRRLRDHARRVRGLPLRALERPRRRREADKRRAATAAATARVMKRLVIAPPLRFHRRTRPGQYQPGAIGPQAPPQSFMASMLSCAVTSCICAMLLAARIC